MHTNLFVDRLVQYMVAFIGNGRLVRNCYMRAKIVEAIAMFSPQRLDVRSSPFFERVQTNELSVGILSQSLMQFYVGR
jgi:hypothetical protein